MLRKVTAACAEVLQRIPRFGSRTVLAFAVIYPLTVAYLFFEFGHLCRCAKAAALTASFKSIILPPLLQLGDRFARTNVARKEKKDVRKT